MKRVIVLIFMLSLMVTATSMSKPTEKYLRSEEIKLNKQVQVDGKGITRKNWSFDKFAYNNPDLFWLGHGGGYYYFGDTISILQFKYVMPKKLIKKRRIAYERKVNGIVKKARKQKGPKAKIRYVDKQLCKMITYKRTKNCHNAYGALVEGKAVCAGYSKAFKDCMNRLNIPCEYVFGAPNGRSHVWNRVTIKERRGKRIVKKKYHVDVTWNDTSGTKKYLLKRTHR